jgi:hypothetical protein
MTVSRNSLHTGYAVVGFVPVQIGNPSKAYSGVRYSCPSTNTSPIVIGPAVNDCEFQIEPGHDLDIEADSSVMWAFAFDVGQQILWCQI